MRNQPDIVPSPHVFGLLLAPDHSSTGHLRARHVAEDDLQQCAGPQHVLRPLEAAGAPPEEWTAPACADCARQQLRLVAQMPAGLIWAGMVWSGGVQGCSAKWVGHNAEVMPESPSTTKLVLIKRPGSGPQDQKGKGADKL